MLHLLTPSKDGIVCSNSLFSSSFKHVCHLIIHIHSSKTNFIGSHQNAPSLGDVPPSSRPHHLLLNRTSLTLDADQPWHTCRWTCTSRHISPSCWLFSSCSCPQGKDFKPYSALYWLAQKIPWAPGMRQFQVLCHRQRVGNWKEPVYGKWEESKLVAGS